MNKLTDENSKTTLYCSFCGKSQHEVRKLIAGPTVFICDECVELCLDIIKEESQAIFNKSGDKYSLVDDIKKANVFKFDKACELAKKIGVDTIKVSMVKKTDNGYILV